VTLSSPVIINGKTEGVVAIDFHLENVFTRIINYRPNDVSYAFVINEAGNWIDYGAESIPRTAGTLA